MQSSMLSASHPSTLTLKTRQALATTRLHLGALCFPLGLLLQDVQPHTLALRQRDEGLVVLSNDEHV